MPTPQALHAEITAGPLSAELATPFAKGDDSGCAAALNRRDRPGYVTPRHLLSCVLSDTSGVGLGLAWLWRHGAMPDGSDPGAEAKAVVASAFYPAELSDYNFRLPPDRIIAGATALGMSADFKAAVLAG